MPKLPPHTTVGITEYSKLVALFTYIKKVSEIYLKLLLITKYRYHYRLLMKDVFYFIEKTFVIMRFLCLGTRFKIWGVFQFFQHIALIICQ